LRRGRIVAINRNNLRLALVRPMLEEPLTKKVTVGWAYVATDHELRGDRPADEVVLEWRALDPNRAASELPALAGLTTGILEAIDVAARIIRVGQMSSSRCHQDPEAVGGR
jgi:hypothetical protein